MNSPKKKYHALIVEDNPLIVDQLSGFLAQTGIFDSPGIAVTGTQAITMVHDYPIDLLFLDIELPDMNGLDLLRSLPYPCPTVVVSAFPTYAVDCYDHDVQDFLTKPLTYIRFLRSLSRTILKPKAPVGSNAPEVIALSRAGTSTMPKPKPVSFATDYIYLRTGRINQRFAVADVMYLEAYNIYTKIFSKTDMVVINEQISTLANELLPHNFVRVHKSYIININQVIRYNTNTIWLPSRTISIGRTFKDDVLDRLKMLNADKEVENVFELAD